MKNVILACLMALSIGASAPAWAQTSSSGIDIGVSSDPFTSGSGGPTLWSDTLGTSTGGSNATNPANSSAGTPQFSDTMGSAGTAATGATATSTTGITDSLTGGGAATGTTSATTTTTSSTTAATTPTGP